MPLNRRCCGGGFKENGSLEAKYEGITYNSRCGYYFTVATITFI